jgi:hypothetical protein
MGQKATVRPLELLAAYEALSLNDLLDEGAFPRLSSDTPNAS